MWPINSSRSGCSIGSPPLNATTDVPSAFNRSMRCFITSVATGADTLSYSLQYPQSMLQRRIGMTCTSSGCAVCASPRANSRADRTLRLTVVRNANRAIIAYAAGSIAGRSLRTPSPTFSEPLKIDPTGMSPKM